MENISETYKQAQREANEDSLHETVTEETSVHLPKHEPETSQKFTSTTKDNFATTETVALGMKEQNVTSSPALRSTEPFKPSKEDSKKNEDNNTVAAVVAAVLAIALGMILYHMFKQK